MPDLSEGWICLHEDGSLSHAQVEPVMKGSSFIRVWPVTGASRVAAWFAIIEAIAIGGNPVRIKEFVAYWSLTDENAQQFVVDSKGWFQLLREGTVWRARFGDPRYPQERHTGYGETALEAFANAAGPCVIGACAHGHSLN